MFIRVFFDSSGEICLFKCEVKENILTGMGMKTSL